MWLLSQFDHRLDFDPGIGQIQGGAVAVIVAGQDYRSLAGAHTVEANQPLDGAAHHDAGQVVVAKYCLLFQRAHTHNGFLRAYLVQPLTLDHR